MQVRLVASRVLQCSPLYVPVIMGQQIFERCLCTVQRNLKPATSNISSVYHQQCRFRRKGPKRTKMGEDESDSDIDDGKTDTMFETSDKVDIEPGAKMITYKLGSPRVDRLLQKALNVSGKKVEDLFYDKKIQINGEVLMKKARTVEEGDIITVPLEEVPGKTARGALIEVRGIIENENNCSVKVLRNKNTLVSV